MSAMLARFLMVFVIISIAGCGTTYTTPGGGAGLVATGDTDIAASFEAQPEAPFPANLAVVRVQSYGYLTATAASIGLGRMAVVTTRDVESDAAFAAFEDLPQVRDVAPLGRLLVPDNVNSIDDFRAPAARLRADMLLVYTIDSTFVVDGKPIGPMSVLSLGFVRDREATVTSTVAGVLLDVRSGFVYGTTEATAERSQIASAWSTRSVIDSARLAAEQEAFDSFTTSFDILWSDVLDEYATAATKGEPAALRDGWHRVSLLNNPQAE